MVTTSSKSVAAPIQCRHRIQQRFADIFTVPRQSQSREIKPNSRARAIVIMRYSRIRSLLLIFMFLTCDWCSGSNNDDQSNPESETWPLDPVFRATIEIHGRVYQQWALENETSFSPIDEVYHAVFFWRPVLIVCSELKPCSGRAREARQTAQRV